MRSIRLVFLLLASSGCAAAQSDAERIADLTAQLRAAQDKIGVLQAQLAAGGSATPVAADLQQLQARNAQLQADIAKWQQAYQQAAVLARQLDSTSKAGAKKSEALNKDLTSCEAANAQMQQAAEDTLKLYQDPRFQSLAALAMHPLEPVLGLRRVQLENMVQDYEDKIRNAQFTAADSATSQQ